MLYIHKNLKKSSYQSMFEPENTPILSGRAKSSKSSISAIKPMHAKPKSKSASVTSSNRSKEIQPLYLFYFLKPGDLLITTLVDIICKMRLKYSNKGNLYTNESIDWKKINLFYLVIISRLYIYTANWIKFTELLNWLNVYLFITEILKSIIISLIYTYLLTFRVS